MAQLSKITQTQNYVPYYDVVNNAAKLALTGLPKGFKVRITGELNRREEYFGGGESSDSNWSRIGSDLIGVVTAANSAARKLLSTYTGLGITPYVGMRVVQADQVVDGYPSIEWCLADDDVTANVSWFSRVLTNPETGELVADLRLADFTGIVPPLNSFGQVGGEFRVGDGVATEGVAVGVGIPGDGVNFIVVDASSDSAATNGANLLTAYTAAKALTPSGAALSATNRATLFLTPGIYSLASGWTVDGEFVDVFALGTTIKTPSVLLTTNTINVTADNVRVSGISVGTQNFTTADSKPLQVFENCTGGTSSFGGGGTFSGTATNCTGGSGSFSGNFGTFSGTATNCIGGNYSFGGYFGTFSGTATNCTGDSDAFGGGDTFSGTATNCTGGSYSFGSGGTFSGTATNCTGGSYAFGGNYGTLSGKLYRCRLTSGDFETVSGSGQTRLCLTGTNVENNQG